MNEQEKAYFRQILFQRGLSWSKQREEIADTLFRNQGHITVEELYHKIKKKDRSVGLTTVYRTLQLLAETGLAKETIFEKEKRVYERRNLKQIHHDHLLCKNCRKVIEFHDKEIEKLQHKVASKKGFIITNHQHVIEGLCQACFKKLKSKEKKPALPLNQFKENQDVCLIKIPANPRLKNRLSELGIYENCKATVVKNDGAGPLVLKILNSKIAIGRGQSQKIYARSV